MPVQRTLLERIRRPGPSGARQLRVSAGEVSDSILKNLQDILNTAQGNCLIDHNYGLPHMTAIRSAMPRSIASFEAAIRTTIEKFEPRLKNVRVVHAPKRSDGMELRFDISGVVIDEDGRTTVRFQTFADEDGKLVVK
ncbi:lysozyme-like protein [Phycisphaerae bacterium RAS1]|nr:lysozyme-like protein [Phycisphaerae bacterium RAS1]